MRKLFLFPSFLLGILVVFQSCSRQSPAEAVAPMRTNTVNATIAPNGSYQLSLDNSGVVTISKQASHFQVSQTESDKNSSVTFYKYIPAADYRGTDEVVLSSTKSVTRLANSVCNNNLDSDSYSTTSITSYTTIKINITD